MLFRKTLISVLIPLILLLCNPWFRNKKTNKKYFSWTPCSFRSFSSSSVVIVVVAQLELEDRSKKDEFPAGAWRGVSDQITWGCSQDPALRPSLSSHSVGAGIVLGISAEPRLLFFYFQAQTRWVYRSESVRGQIWECQVVKYVATSQEYQYRYFTLEPVTSPSPVTC